MATRKVLVITDDVTGKVIENDDLHQVAITVDGKTSALDLSSDTLNQMMAALAPFVAAGRRVKSPTQLDEKRTARRRAS